jgi:hypothetical protein
MKLQRKELWLFTAPLLVLGSFASYSAWTNRCTDHCYADVGRFSSDAAGTEAALQQLSQTIKRCPQSLLYTARYRLRSDDVSIKYEPSTMILVYEPDHSGYIQLWRNVKIQNVHSVAQTGILANLKHYGCYRTR